MDTRDLSLGAVILGILVAVFQLSFTCTVLGKLCKHSDAQNTYQKTYKVWSTIAIVLFSLLTIFTAIYFVWMYLDFDHYKNESFDDIHHEFIMTWPNCIWTCFIPSKSIVLYLCNSRLYYTFVQSPQLKVSKAFYYAMNIFACVMLPAFLIVCGFVNPLDNIPGLEAWDLYRYAFILLLTIVCGVFNHKLYLKTTDQNVVRAFKVVKQKKLGSKALMVNDTENEDQTETEAEDEEVVTTRFLKTATGRNADAYMAFNGGDAGVGDENGMDFLLNVITRYSIIVMVINLSMIVTTMCWTLWMFPLNTGAISSMIPFLYQSVDALVNSICLFLLYSYGDEWYRCMCLRYCSVHRCCEKCCVGLAKLCI